MTDIVRFRMSAYTPDDADYVNALPELEVYELFHTHTDPSVLTAALYAISKFEAQALNLLASRNSQNFTESWLLQNLPIDVSEISPEVIKDYTNIYLRDELLFSQNLNTLKVYPEAYVVVHEGTYAGHIWTWNITIHNSLITNMLDFRMSLLHIADSSISLSTMCISAVKDSQASQASQASTDNQKFQILRILQPPQSMSAMLTRCGFVRAQAVRTNTAYNVVFDTASVGGLAMARPLLFREYDYIINTHTALNCYIRT